MVLNGLASEKLQPAIDSPVVGVSFCHVRVSGGQVTSHEADGRVEKIEADPDSTLVARQALKTGLLGSRFDVAHG